MLGLNWKSIIKPSATVTQDTVQIAVEDMGENLLQDSNTMKEINKAYSQSIHTDSVIVTTEKRYDEIAMMTYGSEKFWVYIYLVNKSYGANPYNLHKGEVVYLPSKDNFDLDVSNAEAIAKASKIEKEILAGNL